MRIVLAIAAGLTVIAQTPDRPVRAVTDPGVVTTRQMVTPAGVPTVFQGRVYAVRFHSNDEIYALTGEGLYRMDWRRNLVEGRVAMRGRGGIQALDGDTPAWLFQRQNKVWLHRGTDTKGVEIGRFQAGALRVRGNRAFAALAFENQLAVIGASGTVEARIPTGIAPVGLAVDAAGTVAYVGNWGGRVPKEGEVTAPTGMAPTADKVLVDARGVAASGTVSRVDVAAGKVTGTIAVGLHPTALAWDEARGKLYVANTNSDSISVVDTRTLAVTATWPLQPFSRKVFGIAPTALAVSADGARLYVACGGINAVMVLRTATGTMAGAIPTYWYPSSLALSPDGKRLAVGALLGVGSGWQDKPERRFVHANRGSVQVVDLPAETQLASYTTAVLENNRMAGAARPMAPATKPVAIPARSGDPSLIEHVVYIIKENRTYDQLFGDLPRGNGDPALVLFGQDVTPNQRKIAQQFVLLDNFYATGGNSADGHQWATQANETAYCLWPGYDGRSYPYNGTDPLAYSSSGFLWDYALARGRSVKVYGEYAGALGNDQTLRKNLLNEWQAGGKFRGRWNIKAPIAKLNTVLAPYFPPYSHAVPDVVRADLFVEDLQQWEKDGKMPNLSILLLPCDHTEGTRPGSSSPKAMVADNDFAVGKIVEALSKSKFWKKTAVFIVEDDAQNGVDHVDGHRTVALVASPYAKRGHVDSTFYSHQSMLKTIELILGLPTMSLFDLIANEMRESFTESPDFSPFVSEAPKQSLFEVNPPLQALKGKARQAARDSAKMRFDVPDAAPTEKLNRAVWGAIKGWNVPYPTPPRAVFAPITVETDEEEEEERAERAARK
ncbi:MAG: bifunctional YncE family protein/alkaline phosphatase family protein [Acidobacteria bacterium]|nr:bifunctional YncE family protein/alkaline phosphatase family protein [Acidobacteriota bacterium]